MTLLYHDYNNIYIYDYDNKCYFRIWFIIFMIMITYILIVFLFEIGITIIIDINIIFLVLFGKRYYNKYLLSL